MISRFFVIALVAALAVEFAVQAKPKKCYVKNGGTIDCKGPENSCMTMEAAGKKVAGGCAAMPEGLDDKKCTAGPPKLCYCQKDKCNGHGRRPSRVCPRQILKSFRKPSTLLRLRRTK